MFCGKCGNPVGESEKFCSQCGAPLPEMEPAGEAVTEETSAEPAGEAAAAAPVEPEEFVPAPPLAVPQVQEPPIAPAVPVEKPEGGKNPGKKKGKKAPWIIAACAVAVLVTVCTVNAEKLGNFFRRSFASPEKYYQAVEEKTVMNMVDAFVAYYEALIKDAGYMDDGSIDMKFALELGEGGQELIEMFALSDVDLTWLKELSVGMGYAAKDSLLGYNMSLGLNKYDILSLKMIMDMEGGDLYLQIPELSANYIGAGMEEYGGVETLETYEQYLEAQEMLAEMRKAMPESKEIETLLRKYLKLALGSVSDVEKSTKTVKAGDVEQKCTELEVTFNGKTLSKMLEAILKELQKDKALKKLYVDMVDGLMETGEFYGISGEYAWEELMDEAEDLLGSLDELEDLDDVLVMKVYVDGSGEIVGRVLELVDGRETYAVISVLSLEKGGKLGYECSVEPDSGYGSGIALTGTGRKSGDKLTGDFQMKYGGVPVLDLKVSELDMKEMDRGYLNGSVTMTFSKQIASLLSSSLSSYGTVYASMLADMELTVDFQSAEKSGKAVLGIGYGDKELADITLSAEFGDGSEISVPSAADTVFAENEEELVRWLESIDWDGFAGKLEDANLPDEVVDKVKELAGLLDGGGIQGLLNRSDDYYGGYLPEEYPGNDSYGGWEGEESQLEQLLQTQEWQDEMKGWNAGVAEMGIRVDTMAEGNTLIFAYYLPDSLGGVGEAQGALMADAFLGTLEDAGFMEIFEESYGISLDAVRCVIYQADGTELYRDEMK